MNLPVSLLTHTDCCRTFLLTLCLLLGWRLENWSGTGTPARKWHHILINARFVLTGMPVQAGLGLAFTALFRWGRSAPGWLVIPGADLPGFWERVSTDICAARTSKRNCYLAGLYISLGVSAGGYLLGGTVASVHSDYSQLARPRPFSASRAHRLGSGLLFVTPNLHQVNHHDRQPYTDTNYGDVLIIWDRLFGTFSRLAVSRIYFGMDTPPTPSETTPFIALLTCPSIQANVPAINSRKESLCALPLPRLHMRSDGI